MKLLRLNYTCRAKVIKTIAARNDYDFGGWTHGNQVRKRCTHDLMNQALLIPVDLVIRSSDVDEVVLWVRISDPLFQLADDLLQLLNSQQQQCHQLATQGAHTKSSCDSSTRMSSMMPSIAFSSLSLTYFSSS